MAQLDFRQTMKNVSKRLVRGISEPTKKETPDFSDYVYNCVDQSVLLEPFRKYYLVYWHRLIPGFVTANAVTIIASACMWFNFLFVLFYSDRYPIGILGLVSALCLHLYVVGDNLDGMRAKASNTSSPLGEFLDHYLDTYNISLSVVITAYLIPVEENYLVFLVIFMMMMSFIFTMADQKVTGQLFFGRINSLEMSMMLTLFYLLLAVPPFAMFWSVALIGHIKIYGLLALVSIMLQLPVILIAIRRMEEIPTGLVFFVISFFGLLLLTLPDVERIVGVVIITFYGAEYIGRILLSHLGKTQFPWPRYDSLAIIIGYAILRSIPVYAEYQSIFSLLLGAYLIFAALIVFARSFWLMRRFWLWKNP